MDQAQFSRLVSQINIGKHLPEAIYLHKDAFSALPDVLQKFIPAVGQAVSLPEDQWDLVKLFRFLWGQAISNKTVNLSPDQVSPAPTFIAFFNGIECGQVHF